MTHAPTCELPMIQLGALWPPSLYTAYEGNGYRRAPMAVLLGNVSAPVNLDHKAHTLGHDMLSSKFAHRTAG